MTFEITAIPPKLTKDFLLSQNSEETYMSTYLGIPVRKGLFISPLRKDHKPTASFYRNKKQELIFHDFGIGFHGNFIDVVKFINQCDYRKALHIIAEDFHYIEKESDRPAIKIKTTDVKIEEKAETTIQIEPQPFQDYELRWWQSFGIQEKTLKKFKVFSCKSVFLNGIYYKSSSPRSMAFGYYGGRRNGSELWRIYFPQNHTYRFLSNWPRTIIQGIRQLPKELNDQLVITKSLKDTMILYEAGIPAIAPCSETVIIQQPQMDKLTGLASNIIYIGDNDLPGVKGAHKYKKLYPFIRCVFIKRKYAKDMSDLYKFVGQTEFNEAIEELKEIFNEKEKRETKHFWVF